MKDNILYLPEFENYSHRYPFQYVQSARLNDGTNVVIRPVRPEDEPLLVKFHESLSERSVYMRWFTALGLSQRIAPERLKRVCSVDYQNEMVLVAEHEDAETGERSIMGAARLVKVRGTNDGEISLTICDSCQRLGLGRELIKHLIQIGQERGFDRIVGDVHPENYGMKSLCKNFGFQVRYSLEEEVTKISLPLPLAQAA